MGGIDKDRHRPWLAYALEESLEHALLTPKNVVDHANPEVLVDQLPAPVISMLLSRALSMGTFSAAQVLESVPPGVLAEHLDPEVMWRCLKEAAERGGISNKASARGGPAREWFASVLGRALESNLITPVDLLRFMPPSEFVATAPRPVLAELMRDALVQSRFDADLVIEHVTPTVIADHLETALAWDCIAEAASRHFGLAAPVAPIKGSGPVTASRPAIAPPHGPAQILPPPPPQPKSAVVKPPDKERTVVVDPAAPTAVEGEKTPMPATVGAAASPPPPRSPNGGPIPPTPLR